MNKQGFVDANGYGVEVGTLVEYQDKRFATVTDLTQDGDVSLHFLDGERMQTKWRTVAKLPENIASQIRAAQMTANPAKVAGYTAQPDAKVALVNSFKELEERLYRAIEKAETEGRVSYGVDGLPNGDHRDHNGSHVYRRNYWVERAVEHFAEGFMALNRAVFQPQRIRLPEDGE